MELHNKFALPFTCLLFGVLGLALGLSTQKGGKISGFIISLIIIFVYYTLSTSARSLILKGTLSPGMGMWMANIFLVVIGALFFWLNSRESTLPRIFRRKSSIRKDNGPAPNRKPLLVLTIRAFRLRLLKRIDHYVSRRILLTFFMTYISLMLVFFIIGIVELIDDVVDNGIPFHYTLRYVIYNAPSVSAFTIPVSLLTAVLLSYSWMSKNNEITAVQISGTSLHRLALPALWIGLLFSLAAFFLQEKITPDANRLAEKTLNVIHKREMPTLKEREKNWVEGHDNTFYFYNHRNQRTGVIHQFNMLKLDADFRMGERVFAKKAAWINDTRLQLTDGFQRRFSNGAPAGFSAFDSSNLPVPEGRDFFFRKVAYTQHMNIRELQNYIHYLKDNNSDTQRFRAELFQKYAFPFSSLIMVLIAIPFSFMMGSKGTLYGIGIAVGISMIFWGIVGMFNSLGTAALLSPALSAFAPLILFAALSMGLFLQVRT
jgi:LPS export ABC transporter permease LptG